MQRKTAVILEIIIALPTLVAISFWWKYNVVIAFIFSVATATLFLIRYEKNEFFLFVFGFVAGFLIEASAVRIGFEHFPNPTLWGVPLWMPFMWGFAFIIIRRVGNELIGRRS